MKTIIVLGCLSFLGFMAHGQSYEKAMKEAFELWDENKDEQAVALFQRIAQAEPDQWLPSYYAANVDIVHAFNQAEEGEVEALLERAKDNIAEAKRRSPDNSEITTLEGSLYTAYVTMNPAVYGQRYSGKIMRLHEEAIALNPDNPRAHMNLIEYEMGYARFMGQDMSAQCELMKTVVVLFDEYENEEPFAPQYGKERALQIIENCNESK